MVKTEYYWKGEVVIYNNISKQEMFDEKLEPIIFDSKEEAKKYLRTRGIAIDERFLFVPVNHIVEYSLN